MAVTKVEKTALGAGLMRALEARARQPLFDDPLIARLITGWPAAVVASRPLRWLFLRLLERAGPGFYGSVVCRTRVIDDACQEAITAGAEQVVILGAGLDTRPCRLPQMRAVRVWELDLPAVQAIKKAALRRALGALPSHIAYAEVDLTTERVDDVLAAAGVDPDIRTLVLCEAVSMYVPVDAVDAVLAYAGSRPPGSRLVLTYLPRAVADDPRFARWSRRLRWRTAFDRAELAARLTGHGLDVLADLGADDYRDLLLRPLGRTLPVSACERIVIAAVALRAG